MVTPVNIDASGWPIQTAGPAKSGFFPSSVAPVAATQKAMSLSLSSAGRVGFYIDYSERSTVGTHTFYVCRTHGTSGAVSVYWASYGDTHTNASGVLAWADGEADIKVITVAVLTKADGDHRIYVKLMGPIGGAVLHFGETHTTAYGVIDDGTVAADSDAVFYDSTVTPGNGTGTAADPYGSIYDAISNVGSKRYIYGKGTTVPDGTNTAQPAGGAQGTTQCILAPATRTGESDRLYVRNWPGYTWTIDGTGTTNTGGFYTETGESWHTYRGIAFTNLDNSSQTYVQGFGIFYRYSSPSGINVELCAADTINGATGTNSGAYMVWGVDGSKIWRCTSNNIQENGNNASQNTSGIYTYSGKNISVQRCEITNSYSAAYQKRIETDYDVSINFRFNRASTSNVGVLYHAAASTGAQHSYTVVQGNIFKGCAQEGIDHEPGTGVTTKRGEKHWWCNNVFDSCGSGEQGAIYFTKADGTEIFNNIMLNCRKVWAEFADNSANGMTVEYADYNIEYGTVLTSQRYEWEAGNYTTAALLYAASGLANNDQDADPTFVDTTDYVLDAGSPAIGGGVGGVDCGVYLIGPEVIGA